MAEATILNPDFDRDGENLDRDFPVAEEVTRINPLLAEEAEGLPVDFNATVVNERLAAQMDLPDGTLLCGGYRVRQRLGVRSGEADLYLCDDNDGRQFVAKIYRRQGAVKDEVITQLQRANSPYIARLCAVGDYGGRPVTVWPFYRNGSLAGKKFSAAELKNMVIPCLNEGLRALHSLDIIHKDLKPSNIMLDDDGKKVVIIDFGISSVRDGNTVVVTQTGMTPDYSAPETFRRLFLEESDYYSLGVTIYEALCGKPPYAGLPPEEIEQFLALQKIPFPTNTPEDLAQLISALTYRDITNRKDKDNPNRRWTYAEVKNWCAGLTQALPGQNANAAPMPEKMRPYTFRGKTYATRAELALALAENWADGKKHLFQGVLSGFFVTFDPETASRCKDAEEEYLKDQGRGDLIFQNILYDLDPGTRKFFWKGQVFAGLHEFGATLLQALWDGDAARAEFAEEILGGGILGAFIERFCRKNRTLLSAVSGMEKNTRAAWQDTRGRRLNLFLLGYMLSGKKNLRLGTLDFRSLTELSAHLGGMLAQSVERFEEFCRKLVGDDGTLDPQFEAWMVALGHRDKLTVWKEKLKE